MLVHVRWLVLILVLSSMSGALGAARLRLQGGALWNGEQRFVLRGVAYSNVPAGETPGRPLPQAGCLFARDLPLIARMGANTVRTYELIPEGDLTFVPLLEQNGLYWLAGFPLEPFHDPGQSIGAKKARILEAFRKYASRFHRQARLIGYVFGNEVAEDYRRKFAGTPDEFYSLLADAAAILKEIEPGDPPLLTTAVRDPREFARLVPGLSFWAWNAGSRVSDEARPRTALPVLISEFGVDAFDHAAGQEDEQAQATAAAALAQEIEASSDLLGGVYSRFVDEWWRGGAEPNRHTAGGPRDPGSPDGWRDEAWMGIFRAMATEQPGFDSLSPRAVYRMLAGLWGGRVPETWAIEDPPRIEMLVNAASGADAVSPGALVRVTGEGLSSEPALAAGASCLCVGDSAAPVGRASDGEWIAQVPWTAEPGERGAVLYRAGRASNVVTAKVQKYAPAVFDGGVVRAGTDCRASARNGVRPGEVLEVYSTGLGAGPFESGDTEALLNGAPAEVLYAGLLPAFVGLNQVNLRVSSQTPPNPDAALELRRGGLGGAPYPLGVAGLEDRAGIVLDFRGEEPVLQPGGEPRGLAVSVEGVNGYCGPVLFQATGLAAGISFRAPVAFTGHPAALELRAGPEARPAQGSSFTLIGYANGVASGSLPLRFTVLPSRGDIPVRVISGGYKSQPLARFDWNGRTIFATTGGGPGRGLNVLAVDPQTGVFPATRNFDTWGDETASAALAGYLAALQPGTVVLLAVADDGSHLLTSEAREAIAGMFGSLFIGSLGYQDSWAMIGRKGAAAPIAESTSSDSQVILERVLTFPAP